MIKKMFITFAIVGLAVNLYGDLQVLAQNRISIRAGERVVKSYELSRSIDSLRIGILESLLKQKVQSLVRMELQTLASQVQEEPDQLASVVKLSGLSDREILSDAGSASLETISKMAAGEDRWLRWRIEHDREANRALVRQALFCNAVDILLIFLFLGFFIYERRQALGLQKAMSRALVDFQSTNQQLRCDLNQIAAHRRRRSGASAEPRTSTQPCSGSAWPP